MPDRVLQRPVDECAPDLTGVGAVAVSRIRVRVASASSNASADSSARRGSLLDSSETAIAAHDGWRALVRRGHFGH
jgi:hypothetical protein